ncbi:MAG TPA: hypothetical protein VHN74_18975, partial [Candidatus Angelobacter sp.]|nr:hypothetical protein [Candidatus Angelobacter sp.]
MEYIFLFLVGWVVVCLPALFYASVVDGRRRRDADEFTQRILSLSRQIEKLERRVAETSDAAPSKVTAQPAAVMKTPHPPESSPVPAVPEAAKKPVVMPAPVPQPQLHPALSGAASPEAPGFAVPTPAATQPPPTPPLVAQEDKRSTPSASTPVEEKPVIPTAPAKEEPRTAAPAVKPVTPSPTNPVVSSPVAALPTAFTRPRETTAVPADAAARVQAPPPPGSTNPPRPPASIPPPTFAQISRPAPTFKSPDLKKKSFTIEEALGANWGPRVGIAFVVIGVALFVGSQWSHFAPWLRMLIVYAAGFGAGVGFLAGGIFLEKKEQYRILGRCLIGGGWAVTTLMTYVLSHGPFAVLASQPLDLSLLLAVIAAMVWHTLRYNSQLVTGAAFLLGFTAIALNPDPPFNLVAGGLLIAGMTVIVLRQQWYELEVFGILAAYLNHFYWLYS